MYDAGKILTGLVIFLALVTFPIWSNLASGEAAYKIEPKIVTEEKQCVAPTDYMRASHMALLNEWRNSVVRDGNRIYETLDGRQYEMSLSNTCAKCHSNKTEFCDKCHTSLGVRLTCWNCHNAPKENN